MNIELIKPDTIITMETDAPRYGVYPASIVITEWHKDDNFELTGWCRYSVDTMAHLFDSYDWPQMSRAS